MLNNICFSFVPCLRKYRKIPKNLNFKELSHFYPDIKKGRVIKVYDGDSITIASRIPESKNNNIYKFNLRLNRIDTPEIKSKNLLEKRYAIKIRDILCKKIMNKMVNIKVIKQDKYGRYLAEVSYKKLNINNWLLNNNYALLYDGGAKRSFDSNKFNPELSRNVEVTIINLTPENPNYHNFNNDESVPFVEIDINI